MILEYCKESVYQASHLSGLTGQSRTCLKDWIPRSSRGMTAFAFKVQSSNIFTAIIQLWDKAYFSNKNPSAYVAEGFLHPALFIG
jgi:hypothetical protein